VTPVDLRFGLDLASVASVEDDLAEHGDGYLERTFTADERSASRGGGRLDTRRLAERVAVKSATLKVLPGVDDAIDVRSIELLGDASTGRLVVVLHGRAAELAEASGVSRLAVSVASDGRLAAAAVVAEIAGSELWPGVSPR
jgi:phosphopantetheine--protein transferase-like protein